MTNVRYKHLPGDMEIGDRILLSNREAATIIALTEKGWKVRYDDGRIEEVRPIMVRPLAPKST